MQHTISRMGPVIAKGNRQFVLKFCTPWTGHLWHTLWIRHRETNLAVMVTQVEPSHAFFGLGDDECIILHLFHSSLTIVVGARSIQQLMFTNDVSYCNNMHMRWEILLCSSHAAPGWLLLLPVSLVIVLVQTPRPSNKPKNTYCGQNTSDIWFAEPLQLLTHNTSSRYAKKVVCWRVFVPPVQDGGG